VGAVFRPKDLGRGYRKVIENAVNSTNDEWKRLKDMFKESLTFD
jgi:hypothetical protein